MPRHVTSCYVISRNVTSCHVMSRHVMSCHVMSRLSHVMSRHATSRNVTSCHVMSRHVMSRHITSCHVMSCHTTSRHVTSCHVMSRRKSHDCNTINASLSTDLFHTQLIQVRYNRVRWLSRRVPITYRISGILSSSFMYSFIPSAITRITYHNVIMLGILIYTDQSRRIKLCQWADDATLGPHY